jgi:hypothetical protein
MATNLSTQFSAPVYALYDSSGDFLGLFGQNGGQVPYVVIGNVSNIPTTLPSTSGQLWNNGGVLCIS